MLKVLIGLLTGAIILITCVRNVTADPVLTDTCNATIIPSLHKETVPLAGASASFNYSNTSGCINLDNALSTASLYALSRVTASSVISPK